jgi:hypothetical protein
MISRQSPPQAFIPGILKTETLLLVNKCLRINHLGFSILDRWMLSDPDRMRELEKNPVFLKILIRTQQAREQKVLESPEALEQMNRGLTAHEILTLHGVATTLDSAIAESGAIM